MITESQIKAALRKATAGKKDVELSDGGARGAGRLLFRARPSASGDASGRWFAAYYRGDRRAKTKLGAYPKISLADARKKFREEYAPAISAGAEPKIEQVRRRHANEDTTATVEENSRLPPCASRTPEQPISSVEQILLDPRRVWLQQAVRQGIAEVVG